MNKIAFALLAGIALGWLVHGWKDDSVSLAVERAAAAIRDNALDRESDIAAKVEQRLAELRANQTVIDRGIIREIQNPVYRNVCFSDELVRLLNAAAAGESAYPAEPDGQVSGAPAADD